MAQRAETTVAKCSLVVNTCSAVFLAVRLVKAELETIGSSSFADKTTNHDIGIRFDLAQTKQGDNAEPETVDC